MIKAILFDLDDTLYLEGQFFRSGFAAVALKLESEGVGTAGEIFKVFESIHFLEGREQVFDKAATRIPFPADWVPELVELFRAHDPDINPAPEVVDSLRRLRSKYKLGLVTDGFSQVQRRKIAALGIEKSLDAIVIADDFGREHWKPSPFPILTCCERLGSSPWEAVFVGDNPERDIAGALNAGAIPVRIHRPGSYFYDPSKIENASHPNIASLLELETLLARDGLPK